MRAALRQLVERQHSLIAVLTAWLVLTSPWVSMLRRVPSDAGFFNSAHVWLGIATLVASLGYLVHCTRSGRWRLYFPWIGGRFETIATDARGLLRGRIPSAEGGGLFGTLEGLTLVALFATGATGFGWLLTQGAGEALTWRDLHIVSARVLIAFAILHVVSVSLHVVDFVRD